ncbi:MAG: 50S ribosomal protein L7/L12 [Candidatus Yanofskybacteria bacterium RIFCSPHIGHO2_01_FULL_41_21]|uniref:Large ribosomal subunit protein bL12 n=2 Tax=Candidatus Yanofskyibacteriota TaxID=1752733 RepID=A0A0G0ZHY1_9BACT|nr:MAG: 50S ribosomal protein L7/L12 [Candidatus Yanofskybacteria bacterium GW2011_GWA1_41_6]OGM97770.1 MAG: 50S ribosomal protein L7/L12 [Candidatus Yanofskybacteria bacterium RIFCSPHIGHO2_01_FULL_41_21]
MDKNQFIESIEKMSVAELNDLVKALEEKFGVSAASFAASAGPALAGEGAEAGEEKDSFTVVLKDAGSAKIQVIKALREITGLGLKEAKEMTDKPGSTVKEGVKKSEADEMKKKIEEAGGTVELK